MGKIHLRQQEGQAQLQQGLWPDGWILDIGCRQAESVWGGLLWHFILANMAIALHRW